VKLLKAIIRPAKIEDVRAVVVDEGVPGLTVTEVRGYGRQKGHASVYRGHEYGVTLVPKIEVEVVAPDHLVADEVFAIVNAAQTGAVGDGRVFVLPVERSYRIRTGEVDPL
jgi:nitrogen regulatory protein P-II 2